MDYSAKEEIIENFFEGVGNFIFPSEKNNFESRFLQSNLLLYFVVLLLALKIIAIGISFNFPQNIFFADITKSSLENFVNQTRQSMGLPALVESQKLNQAAQLKAYNMVEEQYFNHTSPNGISPWYWFTRAGYNFKYAGENLAIGFFDSREVYTAWLNSPSHKANIINPNYREIGTAVLSGYGGGNTIIIVQEFGSQALVQQPAANNNNAKPVAVANTDKPKPSENQAPVSQNDQEVLSQTTVLQNVIEPSNNNTSNLFSKSMNFILYNFDMLLQNMILGISLIVIGILIFMILLSANLHPIEYRETIILPKEKLFNRANFSKGLVTRAALIIILLSFANLLNKSLLLSIIPHKIII